MTSLGTFFPENDPPFPSGPTDRLRKEGDFIIRHIKVVAFNGKEYDVTNIRSILNIYEDIFNNVVSGDLTLHDAVDLPQLLPFIGQEKVKIRFTRPEPTASPSHDEILDDIDVEFRVYYVSNRQPQKDKLQMYTMHFVAEEFIQNQKVKLSRSFKGMPYSDMVQLAFDTLKSTKGLVIEPTMFMHDYAVPNINPMEFINTIAARSTSVDGNGSTYLFFSDREKFHFVSLGQLLTQSPIQDYTYQISNVLENNDGTYRDRTIAQDLKTFETYGFSNTFNVLHNLATGMYASRLVTYDVVRQVWETIDFDYQKEFDKFKHLDKYKIHTDEHDGFGAPQALVKFLATTKDHDKLSWIAGKEPGIKPNHVEDFTLYRYSQIQQINNAKIRVVVSGDPRRKAGQVINFKLPQAMGNITPETPEEMDRYLRGNYLVVSLAHRLVPNSYYMEMELVKDSLFSKIEHIDPLKAYEGVW